MKSISKGSSKNDLPAQLKESDEGQDSKQPDNALLKFLPNVMGNSTSKNAGLKNSTDRPRPATTDNSDYTPTHALPSLSLTANVSEVGSGEGKSPRSKEEMSSSQLSARSRAKSSNVQSDSKTALSATSDPSGTPNANHPALPRSQSSGGFARRELTRSATVGVKAGPGGQTGQGAGANLSFAFSTYTPKDRSLAGGSNPNLPEQPKFQTTRARFVVTQAISNTAHPANTSAPVVEIPDVINMSVISDLGKTTQQQNVNVEKLAESSNFSEDSATEVMANTNRKMQTILQSEEKRHQEGKKDEKDARVHVRRRLPVRSMTETGTTKYCLL